jgi:hypothetical protein
VCALPGGAFASGAHDHAVLRWPGPARLAVHHASAVHALLAPASRGTLVSGGADRAAHVFDLAAERVRALSPGTGGG